MAMALALIGTLERNRRDTRAKVRQLTRPAADCRLAMLLGPLDRERKINDVASTSERKKKQKIKFSRRVRGGNGVDPVRTLVLVQLCFYSSPSRDVILISYVLVAF